MKGNDVLSRSPSGSGKSPTCDFAPWLLKCLSSDQSSHAIVIDLVIFQWVTLMQLKKTTHKHNIFGDSA